MPVVTFGKFSMDIDDDIYADVEARNYTWDAERDKVVQYIKTLPDDQQQAAFETYYSLVQARTDRTVAQNIASLEADGEFELADNLRKEWERLKVMRTTAASRPNQ